MCKFKYKDIVRVKEGFFEDWEGVLNMYYSKSASKDEIWYDMVLSDTGQIITIREDNLELIEKGV